MKIDNDSKGDGIFSNIYNGELAFYKYTLYTYFIFVIFFFKKNPFICLDFIVNL